MTVLSPQWDFLSCKMTSLNLGSDALAEWWIFSMMPVICNILSHNHQAILGSTGLILLKVCSHMPGTDVGRSNTNHYMLHTFAVTEWRQGGSKICSATNGSNTQFSMSTLKQHTSSHFCPHQNERSARPPTMYWRTCQLLPSGNVKICLSPLCNGAVHM